MKFIKLHKNGLALLVNLSTVTEVYTAVDNKSRLYFNFAADGEQENFTVDESIDEILEIIKQVIV